MNPAVLRLLDAHFNNAAELQTFLDTQDSPADWLKDQGIALCPRLQILKYLQISGSNAATPRATAADGSRDRPALASAQCIV